MDYTHALPFLVEPRRELAALHHAVVAARGDDESAGRTVARDAGRDWHRRRVEGVPQVLHALPELRHVTAVLLVELCEVEAGAESGEHLKVSTILVDLYYFH